MQRKTRAHTRSPNRAFNRFARGELPIALNFYLRTFNSSEQPNPIYAPFSVRALFLLAVQFLTHHWADAAIVPEIDFIFSRNGQSLISIRIMHNNNVRTSYYPASGKDAESSRIAHVGAGSGSGSAKRPDTWK